jgi:hypothetical protein
MRKPGAPRSGPFADLIEAFHGVSRQGLHLRADSDGILAAFRLRAVKEARSARSCHRCCPGDRLVGAQRRDLPVYLLFGFSPFMVAGIGAVCLLFAGFSLSHPRPADEVEAGQTIPEWAFAAAALVALLPAATILPKSSDDVVWLAAAACAPRRNRCPVSARV